MAHKYVGKYGYSEQGHCASCCTNDVFENVETEAPGGRARPTGNGITHVASSMMPCPSTTHPRQLMTMHERNPYKTPPDFESLARTYPPLRPQSVSLSPSSDFTFVLTPLHIALFARRKAGCLQSTFTTKRPKGLPKSPMLFDCPVAHICYRRLTQALLYRDFGIQLEIPNDRLCPPVPNR